MVKTNVLNHIAVIMDGNGRWADARGLPKIEGHRKGAETAKKIIENVATSGASYLTLYTFSSENWLRPQKEVSDIIGLLGFYLKSEIKNLHDKGIRLKVIGNLDRLTSSMRSKINDAVTLTAGNTKFTLCLAFGYGARYELIEACKKAAAASLTNDLTEETFRKYLYDPEMPDVDLLIRTSGEQRISNFLLWHLAYAELYFTDKLWPDFKDIDLNKAIEDFHKRKRNFGATRVK